MSLKNHSLYTLRNCRLLAILLIMASRFLSRNNIIIFLLSFLVTTSILVNNKMSGRNTISPFWLTIELTEKNTQFTKFYFDKGRGINETDSRWGWSRNGGEKITYRTGIVHPSLLRFDLGNEAQHTFSVQQICLNTFNKKSCKSPIQT